MEMKKSPWSYPVWQVLCICGFLNLAGCGNRNHPKLVPVSGTVTLDGEPLVNKGSPDGQPVIGNSSGRTPDDVVYCKVLFYPDTAKGNTNPWTCEGELRAGGKDKYRLWTLGFKPRPSRSFFEQQDLGAREGAPLGWYKVTLCAPGWEGLKYLKADTTPLSIEVVENPESGHYDIKLEK